VLVPSLITTPTFVDGALVRQPTLNVLPYDIDALAQINLGHTADSAPASKPLTKLTLSAAQNIATGVAGTCTIVTWGTELYDTDNLWTSAAPDHITIRTAGWYRIIAQAVWASGVSSERVVQVLVGGTADPLNVAASSNLLTAASFGIHQQVVAYEHLQAGSTVYIGVYQDSGSTLALQTNGVWGTYVTAAYAAPY
jgi:hypothetical protein